MKYLIAGLGNIGTEYELTRHNIGFLALDRLAEIQKCTFKTDKLGATAEFRHKGKVIYMVKPSTYMNLSGKAVNYWLQNLKIPKENLLVVVDDVALPFGSIRLRGKGSSAGHNGLKNIEELTAGDNYARLKVGIGNNYPKGQQADYVLSRFTKEEFDAMPPVLEKASEMVLSFCTSGIEKTMSQFND